MYRNLSKKAFKSVCDYAYVGRLSGWMGGLALGSSTENTATNVRTRHIHTQPQIHTDTHKHEHNTHTRTRAPRTRTFLISLLWRCGAADEDDSIHMLEPLVLVSDQVFFEANRPVFVNLGFLPAAGEELSAHMRGRQRGEKESI